MEFKTIIKKLRRDRDMTQEALAEALSISPQAVSRWECGDAMPDISLFPALCNLFDVTADYLLGIDLTRKEARIGEIGERARGYSSRGYHEEACTILEAGLREFPNSYKLMKDLMYVTYRQGKFDEAITLGEKILAGCTEDATRHAAIQVLCFSYRDKGEREKAVELARTMPSMAISREILLSRLETGDELLSAKQMCNHYLLQFLVRDLARQNGQLDSGAWAYTPDECAALRDKAIALTHLIFEDGNCGFYHCILQDFHAEQAKYHAGLGDREAAIRHLGLAAEAAIRFLSDYAPSPREFVYTSLLFRGMSGGTFSTSDQSNAAAQLLSDMDDPVFNDLRDDPDFREIVEKLTPHAGKWAV